jgi:hypothetical protein
MKDDASVQVGQVDEDCFQNIAMSVVHEYDSAYLAGEALEILARHRLAAEEAGFCKGLEAAAQVAEEHGSGYMQKSAELRQSEDVIDVEYSVAFHRMGSTAGAVATAIRAIDPADALRSGAGDVVQSDG